MTNNPQTGSDLESFDPIRDRVEVKPKVLVLHEGKIYRIAQILDFESVIGVDVETGRSFPLRIAELRKVPGNIDEPKPWKGDLSEIGDKDWQIAESRFAAIKPLLRNGNVGRYEVESRADEVKTAPATLYRWLQRYRAYGEVTALIPMKRGWTEGKNRILPESEALIDEVIRTFYLTLQRPTAQKTIIEVFRLCKERGIIPPSPGTIRSRIKKVSERERLRGRGFREKAQNKFLPVPGRFPNAEFPLAIVQIDHTPADIIVVDDIYRKPIGRPWITLAMDVYSRMVVGYYLSFDPPSETSVAMCVAHMILPKEEWLILHKVEALWPVWGIPMTIHVDNGPEFRSDNFRKSCIAYGINLEFRPVKQPRYGGHIEKLLGTLLREIHTLPGTTFSSIKDREGYDSDKHSAMTRNELEEWLVTYICKQYHQTKHSTLGISPLRQWEIGIFGNAETTGVGYPDRPVDRMTVLLDFLPSFQRTIQTFGVSIDGMTYYAEALRPWIGSKDSKTGKTRDFLFRRDPRDISIIWFFDPTLTQYFRIPFADQSLPAMSIWEYQQAREILKKEGAATVTDHHILMTITELRNKVEAAKEKTKRARRQAQRRKEHEKKITPAVTIPVTSDTDNERLRLENITDLVDGEVDDFGTIA